MPRPQFSLLTAILGLLSAVLLTACPAPTLDGSDSSTKPQEQIASSGEDKAKLEQELDELLRNSLGISLGDRIPANQPGVAVLVTHNNQILYAQGQGLSDVEAAVPISEQTVFDLASVSKQMTGLALLMLQESGYLRLDEPVRDHLPAFEDPNPEAPVLIADLLHHTSGLADYTRDWSGSQPAFAELTVEDHLTWLNQQEAVALAGESFEYNNSGYGLLALIVQEVSGQSFVDFMAEHIFEPAGMTQTQVYPGPVAPGRVAPGRVAPGQVAPGRVEQALGQTQPEQATGYRVAKSGAIELASEPSRMVGDGNIFSSIADLARYDKALRQGLLVSEQTLALAFQDGTLAEGWPIQEVEGEGYGAGWSLADGYGHHSGSWAGTSTYYRFYREQPVSIVVLANDENFDSEGLGEAIAERLGLE